jgi:secreted trypsin-like serine protease
LLATVVGAIGAVSVGAGSASAIVGGQDAPRLYPGVVSVEIDFPGLGTALCGGSLIDRVRVLTAAHCLSDQHPSPHPVAVPATSVRVRVASLDRSTGGEVIAAQQIWLHPLWQWATNPTGTPVADLGEIGLAHPVRASVLPLTRWPKPVGGPVRLVGWGLTQFPPPAGTVPPALLHQRDTTRLPLSDCAGGFPGPGEMCLGPGWCFGDSGSAALSRTGGDKWAGWVQVGVASRETDETDPCGKPGVATDPWYFRSWIIAPTLTGPIRQHDTRAPSPAGVAADRIPAFTLTMIT